MGYSFFVALTMINYRGRVPTRPIHVNCNAIYEIWRTQFAATIINLARRGTRQIMVYLISRITAYLEVAAVVSTANYCNICAKVL